MSALDTGKALDNLIARVNASGKDFRKGTLNFKPSIVVLDKQYLIQGLGASEAQVDQIYSEVRRSVAGMKSKIKNKSEITFSESEGIVYLLQQESKSGDNFERARKLTRIVKKILGRNDIDTGHLFTASTTENTRTLFNKSKFSNKIILERIYRKAVLKYRLKVRELNYNLGLRLDTDFSKSIKNGRLEGKFVVAMTPQSSEVNQRIISDLYEAAFDKEIRQKLLNLKGSKSLFEMFRDSFSFLWKNKKHKNYSSRAKVSRTVKHTTRKKAPKPAVVMPDASKNNGSSTFTDSLKLQSLLDLRLHDQIKLNMGKGSEKKVLNYRTGRLANSANVQAVRPSRRDGVIDIYYKYQNYPYDTFEKGGKQYVPGREPTKLINKSIRQLAILLVKDGTKFNPIPS